MGIMTVPPVLPPILYQPSPPSPPRGEKLGEESAPPLPPVNPRFCLGNDIFGCGRLTTPLFRVACVGAEQALCLFLALGIFVVVFGILLNALIGD
jgi:hypothetical protein